MPEAEFERGRDKHKILVGKREGFGTHGSLRRMCEDNIKMTLKLESC
jgi:hypothetical protein